MSIHSIITVPIIAPIANKKTCLIYSFRTGSSLTHAMKPAVIDNWTAKIPYTFLMNPFLSPS